MNRKGFPGPTHQRQGVCHTALQAAMAAAKATPKQKASKALKQAGKPSKKLPMKLAKAKGAAAKGKAKATPPAQRVSSKQPAEDPRGYSLVSLVSDFG